ncbi:hypothetical protein EXIGLDRAFT_638135 [Exidia glandulosa HHB12029]|uniref:Autophagy-related protein 14 n=1 Tax=Exidia glandulosa HHB12029 TaxID=1314781 RepID=A0A165P436_EXIGL|nr:hypothetical protein EXIGLDRAFT_638135 [Exidia glandulosa HHB12029]
MECRVCEQRQRQFYCADCLRIHLREFRNGMQHVAGERTAVVARAEELMKTVQPARLERAEAAGLEASISGAQTERDRIREDNERKRMRISHLRASIAARRQALTAARTQFPSQVQPQLAQQQSRSAKLAADLAQTRALLAHHLLGVFQIAAVRGEWTVGGLVLPVPGDMRRFPAEHINAALLHTLHFLRVLTYYLGVKLPFEVTHNAQQPWIRAGQGPEYGGWAKWVHKQPLFIRPSSSASPSSSSSSIAQHGGTRSMAPQESFTTGLTMLMYNVAYLAHTQGLEIGLAQAGEVLRNLWAICKSPNVGQRSHETRPTLPPPTPAQFTLDFGQLLQVTSAAPPPARKARRSSRVPVDDDDGWDFVENEE